MSRRGKERSSLSVLIRIPVFRRLWIAITVSSLGDWLGLLATTALAAYLTKGSSGLAQGAAVSGVLLTRLLPDLLLGPVAAALVDRLDRRTIAVVGDATAGLLYLSIVVSNNLTWLLIAQFLVEAVGLFSNPAKQAMWVNIVPRERLAVANQLNYVSIYGMVPVAAGVFILLSLVAQFFGARVVDSPAASSALISGPTSAVALNIALVIDAATYFMCAGTVLVSRGLIPAYVGERSTAQSVFSLIREGISFVRNSRIMRAIYLGILGAFGAGGLTAGVAQAWVSSLGAGTSGYGVVFGTVFTGVALGMLVGPRLLPTVPRRMIFTSAIGGAGLCLFAMSLLQDFVGAVIISSVMGVFAGVAWITGFTMIGQEVSDQLRGRVFGFVMSSVRLTLLGTIAIGPILAGAVGTHLVRIGDFSWKVSGASVVLAAGGLTAMAVAAYCGRQVGGLASTLLRRLIGSRRRDIMPEPDDYPGALLAVEGADFDAVGQTVHDIADRLTRSGWQVTVLADAAPVGPVDQPAIALRSAAVLSELVSERVRPALERGDVVICADYLDHRVVRYGSVGGLGDELVLRMARWAVDGLLPDLTVLVDVAPVPGQGRHRRTDLVPAAGPAGPIDPAHPWDQAGELVGLVDPAGSAAADETSGSGDSEVPVGSSPPVAPADDPEIDALLRQAYRERASSAPERYAVLTGVPRFPRPDAGPPATRRDAAVPVEAVDRAEPADPTELDPEVTERIASVLRLRSPRRIGEPPSADRDETSSALAGVGPIDRAGASADSRIDDLTDCGSDPGADDLAAFRDQAGRVAGSPAGPPASAVPAVTFGAPREPVSR